MEPLVCSQIRWKLWEMLEGGTYYLYLRWAQSCATVESGGVWCYLRVDGVKIELSSVGELVGRGILPTSGARSAFGSVWE